MPNANPKIIQNPERLEALYRTNLLDSPVDAAFDRLTRLASQILDAPVSLVSLVDADRQFFKSSIGLPDAWASRGETGLSHSFCQHVVASGQPLVIDDARKHKLVHDNLAIKDLNVISYLGMPLTTTEGHGLGSFCVIDGKPRTWTEREISIVRELALSVMTEIELRAEIMLREEAEIQLRRTNDTLAEANNQLRRVTEFTHSTIDYTIDAVQRGAEHSEIMTYMISAQRALRNQQVAMPR